MQRSLDLKVKRRTDTALGQEIIAKLAANGGFCPCATVKNEDTRCICKDFRDKMESDYVGECNCGLYEVTR